MLKKVVCIVTLGAAAFAVQAWPTKPVTIVVPFPPGGSTDLIARTISAKLGEKIGGTVVVEDLTIRDLG